MKTEMSGLRKPKVIIDKILKDSEGREGLPQTRDEIPELPFWKRVYKTLTGNSADSSSDTEDALHALDLLLLLESTNAGVERDAGMKRDLDEVSQHKNMADVVDQRLRILIEGPAIEDSKRSQCEHTVLVEAAKDFLVVKVWLHSPMLTGLLRFRVLVRHRE